MTFISSRRQNLEIIFVSLAVVGGLATAAHAHFPWLVAENTQPGKTRVHVYFSELAEPDDAELLKHLTGAQVRMISASADPVDLNLRRDDSSWVADVAVADAADSLFVMEHEFGVLKRDDAEFLLKYYAKTGPVWGDPAWQRNAGGQLIDLELVPETAGEKLRVTVYWRRRPAVGAEVTIIGPGDAEVAAAADESGSVTFPSGGAGLYSIRARFIEATAGARGEHRYDSIRHYSTLALRVAGDGFTPSPSDSATLSATRLPDLPEPLTSFGGAVEGNVVYVYGGHKGEPHSYSTAEQSGALWKLDTLDPHRWEHVADGPRLQGLALVSHAGKLYRIGGFTAKNAADEDQDLWSQDTVACYDPDSQQWTDLPPLPEPRSSLDAAVLNGKVYVVGGWQLRGDEEPHWHETAWMIDLTATRLQWKPVAAPPFRRRALALAAHEGKLFAVGGMQAEGGPTTRVSVFDPATSTWTTAPTLPGDDIEGFGCAAFAIQRRLYVSTVEGNLQRLSEDRHSWEQAMTLNNGRFFHRMLPLSTGEFIMIGGANFSTGKVPQTEIVEIQ